MDRSEELWNIGPDAIFRDMIDSINKLRRYLGTFFGDFRVIFSDCFHLIVIKSSLFASGLYISGKLGKTTQL